MTKCAIKGAAALMLAMLLAGPSYAANMAEINTCYQRAGDDAEKLQLCLKQELDAVKAEYKDASERVTVVAKAWDKPNRNRTRWDKLMRANQAFDSYVKRECEFVRSTTKGNQTAERNSLLACQINLYSMRTDLLENRYLSSGQK